MILWLALACAAPPAETEAGLSGPRLLRRLSLDLLGELPPESALDAAEVDPAVAHLYARAWMDDPRFEERLVRTLGEIWRTRADVFDTTHYDYYLPDEQEYRFLRSVGEEPLRLAARVAAEDRPWTEIVTADWTMADETLAAIWPLEREAGEGWQVARYVDGRPAAGVLSTNGLWWRYTSDASNMNRMRAAMISELLLCEDVLSRPILFSAAETLDTEEAVREDPYCLGCHASLDPLASALFGFYWLKPYSRVEMESYHLDRERMGVTRMGVEPAWYGQPLSGLGGLGAAVAGDRRFTRCAAETAAEIVWRRAIVAEDFEEIEALRGAFVDGGYQLKPLLASALVSPSYASGGEGEAALRMMNADLLESAVGGLTGFSWEREGWRQLDNDVIGYRVMAGGVDGEQLLSPQQDPGLTWALVTKRLAEGGARALVEGGALDGIALSSAPECAALESLHWRLYALRADGGFCDDARALWDEIDAMAGPAEAWVALLSAMMRSPDFLGY